MTCREIRTILEAFREDTLNTAGRKAVLDHLAECEACRKALSGMDAVDARLRSVLGEMDPSPDFVTRVMRAVARAEAPRAMPRWPVWQRLAAAACVLLLAGVAATWVAAKLGGNSLPPVVKHGPPGTVEPAPGHPFALGPAFVIRGEGRLPYPGRTEIRVNRMLKNGTPEFIVDPFPEG